ncbi:hypothetical protein GWK16_14515 [Roseomonas sp. JC162]|uniref:Uncharacterized protein n=1 Tax=Neoroseomonas marina TaxID=1232220 RepID=A0A848EGG6_9PROT|nr:hypothetical protein [Neoroseomonas marina]NMJ42458.1 hypothetical protein [Neoroseomonas marina]
MNAETRRSILKATQAALRESVITEVDPLEALRQASHEILLHVRHTLISALPPEIAPTIPLDEIFSEAITFVWIELGGRVEDIPVEFFHVSSAKQ